MCDPSLSDMPFAVHHTLSLFSNDPNDQILYLYNKDLFIIKQKNILGACKV